MNLFEIKNIKRLILTLLRWFSYWLSALWENIWRNAISIFFILISYFLLWNFQQPQDLLLVLNQRDEFFKFSDAPLFFFSLFVIACIMWQAPKYLKPHNYNAINRKNFLFFFPDNFLEIKTGYNTLKEKIDRHVSNVFPSVLGAIFIMVFAFGILQAMYILGIYTYRYEILSPKILFGISVFFLLLLLIRSFYSFFRRVLLFGFLGKSILIIFLSIIFGFMIYLGIKNTQSRDDLYLLFTATFLLGVFFLIFSLTRWEILGSNSMNKRFYHLILLFTFLSVLVFIGINIFTSYAQYINPISVFLFGIITYMVVCYFLAIWGKKLHINLLSIVLIFILLISFKNQTSKNFDHYIVELAPRHPAIKRPDMETYVDAWLNIRSHQIAASSKKFPIYFVGSEGGGSKAALWASLVNSYLQENTSSYFEKHLFLLAGASGGNVGNGVFFINAWEGGNTRDFFLSQSVNGIKSKPGQMFKHNFLSTSIASLIGRDALQSILGISISQNRAELLEKEWEKAFYRTFENENMKKDFLSFYYSKKPLGTYPLFMISSTQVQNGNLSLISPVNIRNDTTFHTIHDFYADVENCKNFQPGIKFSTALLLGARYPVINPAGEIEDCKQYVDAGYFDNYGAVTIQKVQEIFLDVLNRKYPHLKSKVDIKNIIILNQNLGYSVYENEHQMVAPVKTILRSRESNQILRLKELKNTTYIVLSPQPVLLEKNQKEVIPVLPLGRYLSSVAVQSIERNLLINSSSKKILDSMVINMNSY